MKLTLYRPEMTDLWFRRMLMADPETMDFSKVGEESEPATDAAWEAWHETWVARPEGHFYRYVAEGNSRAFIGECAYHYDGERYLAELIIRGRQRRRGAGTEALRLLLDAAKEDDVPTLSCAIAIDNPGIRIFRKAGFEEEFRTENFIMVGKML